MCPESYRLHYIEKIRPTGASSALVFGAALDEALNCLLLNKGNAEETFERIFKTQTINGTEVYIPTYQEMDYSATDFDNDLLIEADVTVLKEQIESSGLSGYTDYLSAYKEIKKKESLTKEEKVYYNLANWISLYRKGLLMLHAYRVKVLPRLDEVISVQENIKLENEEGDVLTGLVDLIARVDGEIVLLDNKTASRRYEPDSVETSDQLSLYKHALQDKYGIKKAGYIVLIKNVNKNKVKICSKCGHDGSGSSHKTCSATVNEQRCHGEFNVTIDPEINVQIIIDEISSKKESEVLENADAVNTKITIGCFEKNEKQCANWFGKKCPYYNYCHANKDMTGLTKVGKK